ncbi:hypothetical protein OAB20_06545 [Winogradskyella sp.]|nr:hypothetical protein [Winogradskyella sp.]
MKLNRKKIIAREILIVVACALVFGLTFIGTIPYNYVIKSRIDNLKTTSQSLSDSIRMVQVNFLTKIDKQKEFLEISKSKGWLTENENYKEYWARLYKSVEKDSFKYKWDTFSASFKDELKDEVGFETAFDFENYIKTNSLTPNELELNYIAEKVIDERQTIEDKIQTEKYKLMDVEDRLQFSLLGLFIAGVFAFPLRYLFYAIKWSIKTLKQKE